MQTRKPFLLSLELAKITRCHHQKLVSNQAPHRNSQSQTRQEKIGGFEGDELTVNKITKNYTHSVMFRFYFQLSYA